MYILTRQPKKEQTNVYLIEYVLTVVKNFFTVCNLLDLQDD